MVQKTLPYEASTEEKTLTKDHYFSISFVLSRVLNTGVIMSIEKNENELKGLENTVKKILNKKYAVLFNSYTGAINGALWGQDIVHGEKAYLQEPSLQEEKFIKWLGIELVNNNIQENSFERIYIDWDNLKDIDTLVSSLNSDAIIIDFTGLGFGPCAALATNDEFIWKKSERLKIFGAFDLKTMWTQEETELEVQPGVQFNYRLSPLVAGCVKLSVLRRNRVNEN
ncbi:degT/DnrJ/EryC1/StrS aminotransferase [Priestia filamentosa]|uniref:degT/DnrJ/EryC1/StrS aminotransferase n=1 Tax=Priestia filamentosa TaxID=1402861 RepID=UPI0039822ADC